MRDKKKKQAYDKWYREQNRERILVQMREYRRNHPEKASTWANQNPAKMKAIAKRFSQTERALDIKLRHLWGITLEEYNAKVVQQGGVCAICKRPESRVHPKSGSVHRLSVDHDHLTGKLRGLLCGTCNRALGLLNDDIEFVHGMVDYLQAYDLHD